MRLNSYLKESKMGKLPGRIEKIAYISKNYYPPSLKWTLINPDGDDKTNYTAIENLAWKEAQGMKRSKIIDFTEDQFDVFIVHGSEMAYEANLKLIGYDVTKFMSKLKALKFKIK